jgi:hypothetical protein
MEKFANMVRRKGHRRNVKTLQQVKDTQDVTYHGAGAGPRTSTSAKTTDMPSASASASADAFGGAEDIEVVTVGGMTAYVLPQGLSWPTMLTRKQSEAIGTNIYLHRNSALNTGRCAETVK